MRLPNLYSSVDRAAALREFPSAQPLRVDPPDAPQWWANDDALVCFATVGRWHRGSVRHSFFSNARRLNWSPAVFKPSSLGEYPSIPREIRANENGGRPLHMFTRSGEGPYTYLGETAPAYSWGGDRRSVHASLELKHVVPSAVLQALGVIDSLDPYPADLDAHLHSLSSLSTDARLSTLRRLVEYWHGPLGDSDGIPESEIPRIEIPAPLRWWYRVGGRREEAFCAQNHLLGFEHPYQLAREAGKLVFYRECQGVWEMATLATGEDPPTWSRIAEPGAAWIPETAPLSIALIQACILEASVQSMYFASSYCATREIVDLIERHVPPLLDGDWHVPSFPTRFFVGGGALGFVSAPNSFDDEDGYSVWLGAKSEHPLQFLRKTDPEVWEDVGF